ncbi:hypothetical protein [Alkalihalobacillus trypoxylicola]|uniref:Uncharacterized protein n=1 Tax=Alkalihalobacillus trypoxylicola TaxID=519424 RepID=A0A162F3X8_9BACI|nr:hypothetical protein [Alkalihalobacillus trypoxylicola]KYG34439.1 hypothetical protein AZF04_14745 [Alkalihalobacillus trypoxylicola]
MKVINAKEHTKKYMDVSKKAAAGTYPTKRIAMIGSKVGIYIGVGLLGIGIYLLIIGHSFWIGSLTAGAVTLLSNFINLKRNKS